MNAGLTDVRRRLLSVDDYRLMAEAGVFAPDERVELIEGEIVVMPPIGSVHAGLTARLQKRLTAVLGERALVWTQNPVVLPEHSVPRPDIVLLKPREDDYMRSLPGAEHVLLAVEVADSSPAYDRDRDRDRKIPVFAGHGIREAWLLGCTAETLTVHLKPSANGYGSVAVADLSTPLTIDAFPDIEIDLRGLFA